MINVFTKLCDYWLVVDNSIKLNFEIAEGIKDVELVIHNNELWEKIKNVAHETK